MSLLAFTVPSVRWEGLGLIGTGLFSAHPRPMRTGLPVASPSLLSTFQQLHGHEYRNHTANLRYNWGLVICPRQPKPQPRVELGSSSLLMKCSNQLSYWGFFLPKHIIATMYFHPYTKTEAHKPVVPVCITGALQRQQEILKTAKTQYYVQVPQERVIRLASKLHN